MDALNPETAKAAGDLIDDVVSALERVVVVLGPWPTSVVIVATVIAGLVGWIWWLRRQTEEEANARRSYETTVEKMSSEIRSLRVQLLLAQGRSMDEIQRFLDLTEGFRQTALRPEPTDGSAQHASGPVAEPQLQPEAQGVAPKKPLKVKR